MAGYVEIGLREAALKRSVVEALYGDGFPHYFMLSFE